jgi:hypothetical protein
MQNSVKLQGKIKNIVERNVGAVTIVTASLSQYDIKTGKCAVTISLIGYEGRGAAALRALIPAQESNPEIIVEGELDTLFDKRPATVTDRRAPWTRIAVDSVVRVND